jgi:molybdopterin synthase sulfur carrier subunit
MSATVQVTVRYFASIREAIGHASETVDTTAHTLAELRDTLIARGAPYADVLAKGRAVRMALNQTVCDELVAIKPGDEVAFFPPVTGG